MSMTGKVKCYSGHTFDQRPMSFSWQDKEYTISHIEEEWQEPGKKFFKVRTKDNKTFELCYNNFGDKWLIVELV